MLKGADRYKIEKEVGRTKLVDIQESFNDNNLNVPTTANNEYPEETNILGDKYKTKIKECKLCNIASSKPNPQHFCQKCCLPICNLFFSVQDPNSVNEMVRVLEKR